MGICTQMAEEEPKELKTVLVRHNFFGPPESLCSLYDQMENLEWNEGICGDLTQESPVARVTGPTHSEISPSAFASQNVFYPGLFSPGHHEEQVQEVVPLGRVRLGQQGQQVGQAQVDGLRAPLVQRGQDPQQQPVPCNAAKETRGHQHPPGDTSRAMGSTENCRCKTMEAEKAL